MNTGPGTIASSGERPTAFPTILGMPYGKPLTFDALRIANARRVVRIHDSVCEEWDIADWMVAVTGELGEACNILKKIKRGDLDSEEGLAKVRKEFADIVCYLDIAANHLGIDLGQAVRDKFNEVSRRLGVYPEHAL